jgi:hypothetical protein
MMAQNGWKNTRVEEFWEQAEERTEQVLRAHSVEVEAVARALLERGDLTGKECLEVMANALHGNGHKPEAATALPASEIEVTPSQVE